MKWCSDPQRSDLSVTLPRPILVLTQTLFQWVLWIKWLGHKVDHFDHIHGQNVGFFASQTLDVAGNLRKLPYSQLNPRVYFEGWSIDKVALAQVFFFRHFRFSMPVTIPQNVLFTSVFGGPFRNPCVSESVLNCGFSWR